MASNVSSHRWPAESPGYVPKETGNSTLFSAFSLSSCIEIGQRQSLVRSFFGDLANSCFEMFFRIRKLAYFLPSVVQGKESATPNKICL